MYEISIDISNHSESDKAFVEAANDFIDNLQMIEDLKITAKYEEIDNSKGVLLMLSGIIAEGIKIGAFVGIYNLAKDIFDRIKSAEVTLNFKDGSSITLKNLSEDKALKIIKEHLEKSKDV